MSVTIFQCQNLSVYFQHDLYKSIRNLPRDLISSTTGLVRILSVRIFTSSASFDNTNNNDTLVNIDVELNNLNLICWWSEQTVSHGWR